MLKVTLTFRNDVQDPLTMTGAVESFTFTQKAFVAADTFRLVLRASDFASIPPVGFVTVTENTATLFYGMCDRQICQLDAGGRRLTLTGRSLAGLLTDRMTDPNDAYSWGMTDEVLATVFDHFPQITVTTPFPVEGLAEPPAFARGASDWDRVQRYVELACSTTPRIDELGTFHLDWVQANACHALDTRDTLPGEVCLSFASRADSRNVPVEARFASPGSAYYDQTVRNDAAFAFGATASVTVERGEEESVQACRERVRAMLEKKNAFLRYHEIQLQGERLPEIRLGHVLRLTREELMLSNAPCVVTRLTAVWDKNGHRMTVGATGDYLLGLDLD